MHYLVKVIVQAEDKEEALDKAERYCYDLVEQNTFDWFDMHGRWGDSVPYKVTGKKGKELIKEAMDSNRSEFQSAMNHIRYMVEHYTDDEIFEEDFGTKEDIEKLKETSQGIYYLSRYQFEKAYGNGSGSSYLFGEGDVWGSSIENQKDLKHVLKNNNLWVVPVDCHN